MSDAVLDTVALVRLLEGDLPGSAFRVFRDAESGVGTLFVPEIALGEFLYLAEKGRLKVPSPIAVVEELMDDLRGATYLHLSHLTDSGWFQFRQLKVPELHDRMIAADALARGVPLLTNDPELSKVEGLKTVWK